MAKRSSFSRTSGIGLRRRIGPCRVGAERSAADLLEDGLRHDRARRIARAQKQHVERWGHRASLLGDAGQQAGDVAAELRMAAAAGLGQEGDEVAQRRKADGMDDMAALPRGLGQTRPFQRTEVEGGSGAGMPEPSGDLPCGQAVRTGG